MTKFELTGARTLAFLDYLKRNPKAGPEEALAWASEHWIDHALDASESLGKAILGQDNEQGRQELILAMNRQAAGGADD